MRTLFFLLWVGVSLAHHVAEAQAPDAPAGTVAFFVATGCPAGWSADSGAAGRMILATSRGTDVGKTVGKPLGDAEDRTHVHDFSATLDIGDKSISGASGGGNRQGAKAGSYHVSGKTDAAPSRLPFVQLVVCRKGATAEEPS